MVKLLIATGIYPPDYRGPATMLEALPVSLRESGLEVKILTYSDVGKQEGEDGLVYRVLRQSNPIWRYWRFFVLMWRLGRWADATYVTDIYSVGYFAYLIKKITGKKYIVRFAGDSAWEKALTKGWTEDYIVDFQKKKYGPRIEKIKKRRTNVLKKADKVIAVSQFMSDLAQNIGVEKEKIKVIYNSIDFGNEAGIDSGFVESLRAKYAKEANLIVTACQLTKWKGVDGIIKILPEIKEKIGNINLLVLGEGQEIWRLQKLVQELNVSENVYFLGKIARKEILNYFKAADLFILNSNYEGLSHTLLEVMKAGVPIITTKAGGNPEVIEDGKEGILVEYNNVEELLAASEKILTDSGLAENFVENAKEKLKKFRWETTVLETVNVIKDVTGESR